VPIELKGRTAIVTGASRGIGRATAIALAQAGVNLGLVARDESALQQLHDEVASHGIHVATAKYDFSSGDGIANLAEALVTELGSIDGLVNNAGTFLECDLADLSEDELKHVLQVNLVSPFMLTRELLPQLRESHGRVINVVSTSALQGYAQQSAYCASKAGLLGMMRALAIEEKPNGIRINNLCPGGVDTDFINNTKLGERLAGQVMIAPEDIGEMVVFLMQQPDNIDVSEMTIRRFTK
tara:strand:- start:4508 stop:5227 length:720 start_codon:yes stop_codon:yes gene_type:complete